MLSSPLLLVLLSVIFLVGSARAGRHATSRAWLSGALHGLIVNALNLLVVFSVIQPDESDPAGAGSARGLIAVGFLGLGALVGAVGGAVGGVIAGRAGTAPTPVDWNFRFARVGVLGTLILIGIGGFVTSFDAGLAVPDWPTTNQQTMFLFPLSKMLGGVYYEHAHRLFAVLVGLLTLTIAVFVALRDRRKVVRTTALGAVLLVMAQAYMGGIRVTDAFSGETAASLTLRVAHGVTGQLFLCVMVALAVIVSRTWRIPDRFSDDGTSNDRRMISLLLGAFVAQLLLGALVRHIDRGVWFPPHLLMAMMVFGLALVVGARLKGRHGDRKPLRVCGAALKHGVILQFILGVLAYVSGMKEGSDGSTFEIFSSTVHQVTGALLLATTVAAWLLSRRLLVAAGEQ